MTETSETPINGEVIETNFVDNENLIVTVEKDGEFWYETYQFEIAEKIDRD